MRNSSGQPLIAHHFINLVADYTCSFCTVCIALLRQLIWLVYKAFPVHEKVGIYHAEPSAPSLNKLEPCVEFSCGCLVPRFR
jgi:predicted DsbA family dithiol-disulfide isomerase